MSSRPGQSKRDKIERLLRHSVIDLKQLRSLLWSGVPDDFRLKMWCLSLGVIPPNSARHLEILENRKREFSTTLVSLGHDDDGDTRKMSPAISDSIRQLRLDFPRTFTDDRKFFDHEISIHNALLVWVAHNPGISYFQGLNDLCVPIWSVVLAGGSTFPGDCGEEKEIPAWLVCTLVSKILEDMADHYVFGQPGIQQCIGRIGNLLAKIDQPVYEHLHICNVDLLTILFRWINCLFIREFPPQLLLRVWDVCIADDLGFRGFSVYIALAMLTSFRVSILTAADSLALMELFRASPSLSWDLQHIETLLAEAFVLKSVWHGSF